MATINKLEVTALDPDVAIDAHRHSVPQAGQTYEMPVDVNITGDLTVTGSVPPAAVGNFTGPVTSVGLATTITDKAVTLAKLADGTDG